MPCCTYQKFHLGTSNRGEGVAHPAAPLEPPLLVTDRPNMI